MSRLVVVAGCGVAGTEAAFAARAADSHARVVLLGAEPWPFYARIRLPEVVAGRTPPERLILLDQAAFETRGVELRTGTTLLGFDPALGRAHLSDGESMPFDALILATGARPFVPPMPGVGLAGIVTLRSMSDAVALREAALSGGPVVVLGGGLLGLEIAAAVRSLGARVTVVDVAPWPLSRQVDAEGGEVVRRVLERRGIAFRLGTSPVCCDGDGRVDSVLLSSGERLPASLVVVAAGVRPDVSVASEAGLVVGRGVLVDDRMSTSAEGVFAAGDCTEHRGRTYGIWPAAEAQGRVAGACACGAAARYDGTVPQNTLKVADVSVFSVGDISGSHGLGTRLSDDVYRRLVVDEEGRLIGAILIGDLRDRREIAAAVQARVRYPGT